MGIMVVYLLLFLQAISIIILWKSVDKHEIAIAELLLKHPDLLDNYHEDLY